MATMNVGFAGLGTMGRGMAGRLLAAGHSVRVWNRSPVPVAELVTRGAVAADLPQLFAADVVVSMLADDTAFRGTLLDPALLAGARAFVHVNMATVSVELAEEAAAAYAERGIGYVSAPVLGRAEVAAAGELNILASGDPALIDRVEPLFAAMGRRTWRLGDGPRHAVTTKIAANFMLACAIESLAEACALAEANGTPPAALVEVLTGTLFPGPAFTGYGALVAERRYDPAGFRLALGLKDVQLALSAGAAAHVPLPFGGVLRDAFLDALAHGDGDRDWAAVAAVARRRAALPV